MSVTQWIPGWMRTDNPTFVAIAGAIVGAIATGGVGIVVAKLNPTPPPVIFIVSPDGKKFEIPASSLLPNYQAGSDTPSYDIRLPKSEFDAIAPVTEPLRELVPGLEQQNIIYADNKSQVEIVKQWLNDPYSGYPSLVKALKQLLDNRQGIGNAVPLTIIQGKYLNGNPENISLTYDLEQLKQAYIEAWKVKNSGSALTKFDEIAPLNQSANRPDWSGKWNCNLDGRPAIIELTGNLDPNTCSVTDKGNLCTLIGSGNNVAGRLSDNGGAWQTIYTRPFFPKQGEQPEYDHIIPLELNNQPWLLLRHTWDQRYMSGYTIWEGRAFGIQCHR